MRQQWWRQVSAILAILVVMSPPGSFAQEAAQTIPNPDGRDMFQLNDLASYAQFSAVWNFEIVGHSYLRGPWVVGRSQGAGFNTPRVCGNVGYFSGYVPTVFGTVIVDVSDPANMQPLSFIPSNPGTLSTYLRVSCDRKILILGHTPAGTRGGGNPDLPPPGTPNMGGFSFHDVSDPRNPIKLSEWVGPEVRTHGLEADDRYLYGCASTDRSKPGATMELVIIDYADARNPRLVSTYHVPGQQVGEEYSSLNQLNPDGSEQIVMCHEIVKDGNRLYVAARDAGAIILDISDIASPSPLAVYDFTPPYNGNPGGGGLPAAHTAAPVPNGAADPRLLVVSDEHFTCPPGFVRILDISSLEHITLLSTMHIAGVDDRYDWATGEFICPRGSQSSHLPWFDPRGHGSLLYMAWYDQGLRAFDISNPFRPREVGYYISPSFVPLEQGTGNEVGRTTRESWVDPATNLIYVADGIGGGITVLRYTGPIPASPPIPGVR